MKNVSKETKNTFWVQGQREIAAELDRIVDELREASRVLFAAGLFVIVSVIAQIMLLIQRY